MPLLPDDAALRGTVLYIEDQPTNVDLVAGLFADLPLVRLLIAGDGATGIALTRSARPDFVLLDMHLPDISGLEVVRALSVEISGGLPVVLLTADALSMDIIKAMSLGAQAYWSKPIDPHQLQDGVRRAIARRMFK